MTTGKTVEGEAAVAIAGFVHLIRLMGSELVAGRHRDDVELLIEALEVKLPSARVPAGTTGDIKRAGLELARGLLAPVFEELRDRSERAHLNDQRREVSPARLH